LQIPFSSRPERGGIFGWLYCIVHGCLEGRYDHDLVAADASFRLAVELTRVRVLLSGLGAESVVQSENETSANGLQRRKRHLPSPAAASPTKPITSVIESARKRATVASPVHPASATALCSASGHTLVVKCNTVVAENVSEQLLEQGENAPLYVKMLENDHDPERMVLATYASSAARQDAQSFFARLEGLQFYARSQNQVRITR
jgi:hypothetical protein